MSTSLLQHSQNSPSSYQQDLVQLNTVKGSVCMLQGMILNWERRSDGGVSALGDGQLSSKMTTLHPQQALRFLRKLWKQGLDYQGLLASPV